MMEGVTILNTISNPIIGWVWTTAAIIVFIIALLWSIFWIGVSIKEHDSSWLIMLLFLFLPAILLPAAGAAEVDSYETYQVILDDSVSFNEFLDKYVILEQDGAIYTIGEKEVLNEVDK